MSEFKGNAHANANPLQMAKRVRSFIDEWVIPNEELLNRGDESAVCLLKELELEARRLGLWGSFYPQAWGGKIPLLEEYLPVAEQEARSEYSQEIFGSHSSLDAHMMEDFANDTIKSTFLKPLANGEAISAYAMTDQGKAGSIPAQIETEAQKVQGNWNITGNKWFICNANVATFVTVVAKTGILENGKNTYSMILVPTDAEGFDVPESINILGKDLGQGEITFNKVSVPENYLLGQEGNGLMLMGKRLRIGRLLRSAQWLGMAQRCFDLMGDRVLSERGRKSRLPEKQLISQHLFDGFQAIVSARQVVKMAARSVDHLRAREKGKCEALTDLARRTDIQVNTAKVLASKAFCKVADSAVQVYGAEGLRSEHPVAGFYRIARTTRILDGADEALISSVGKRLMAEFEASNSVGSEYALNFSDFDIADALQAGEYS